MIQVKQHKRTRKNGVTVVRKHMKSSTKKKVAKAVSEDFLDYKKSRHPKTGKIRSAIMDVMAKRKKNKMLNTHTITGSKRTYNL